MKKIILFLLLIPTVLISQDIYHPTPSNKNIQMIDHKYYNECYSDLLRQSECSYYKFTSEMVKCNADRDNKFKSDSLVIGVKIKPADYIHSGFDKGHLSPANHFCYNQTAMDLTFLMSNMCPQLPGFNRVTWYSLEHLSRLWVEKKGECWIYSGPIFDSVNVKKFSKDSIWIPTSFYKIILFKSNSNYEVISFIIPHHEYDLKFPLQGFVTTVDIIEEKTKIDFFPTLDNKIQKDIESRKLVGTWLFY